MHFLQYLTGDGCAKKLKTAAGILAVVLIAGVLLVPFDLKRDLKNLEFSEINISEIPDGTYQGKSSVGPVKVTAEVTVLNGKIETAELLQHRNGMGQDAEALPWLMEKFETWDVDCVSGATISSQAIRQAVNRALASGLQQEK